MAVEDRVGSSASRSAPESVDVLVEEFRGFLGGERGLASETLRCYGSHARAFLTWLPLPVDVALAELSAGLVTGYVVEYCRGRNTESAKAMVTALRSLLRFLHVTGRVPARWRARCRRWRAGGWRRCPAAGRRAGRGAAGRLRPRHRRSGARDYAMLVHAGPARAARRRGRCAAAGRHRLAGRARSLVRGKGNRVERLPLPAEVGEAMAAYLTGGRPGAAAAGGVPARVRAPITAADARRRSAQIVARRLRAGRAAAGWARTGCGTRWPPRCCAPARSLPEVGQVLRHRSQLSTAIYAKVDHDRAARTGRRGRGRAVTPVSDAAGSGRASTWRCAGRWGSS